MKCGDICLVQYPFSEGTAAKLRPVVVVSADAFNRGEDVVVLPISSSIARADPFAVAILQGTPEFRQSGLKFPSSVKCTKPLTISKRRLLRFLGTLAPALMTSVRAILAKLFAIKP